MKNKTTTTPLPPKVTCIGGIFFSPKTRKKKAWYAQHLGLATDQWGSTLEFRNAHRPRKSIICSGVHFKKSDYFTPPKEFMINYRVQNIRG